LNYFLVIENHEMNMQYKLQKLLKTLLRIMSVKQTHLDKRCVCLHSL